MKVFVTGVGGQLGYEVVECLKNRGIECVGSDIVTKPDYLDIEYKQLDITDANAINKTIKNSLCDTIIHCAAWTAVDDAEFNEDKVRAINVDGTQNIANTANDINAKMVYISTDYVFDGEGTEPWKPDCKDYAPLSVYGQSKLDGELAVCNTLNKYFIVRTAWVFGLHGNNYIKTMIDLSSRNKEIRVVNDQIGTPTYTYDLARILCDMIMTEKYGYYHVTNEGGYISWYGFTKEIFRQANINTKVIPVSTKDYSNSVAVRPFNSRLDKSKLIEAGFEPLPVWQDALHRYLKAKCIV